MLQLDETNLPALARGCALLGSGGGGDPDLALTMALVAVREYGPVRVAALSELDAELFVMPCGFVGAPSVAGERVWNGAECIALRATTQELHRAWIEALMPFQIGGANGLLPVTWAARTGMPLVDADGMGRAFADPTRQAMHLAGVAASPVVLTDGRGNTLVLHAVDDRMAGHLAHQVAAGLGGVCAAAMYVMTGRAARRAAIEGSLSLALALGEAASSGGADAVVSATIDVLGAAVLVEGRVIDVTRDGDGADALGSATIQGAGPYAGRQLRLELQSEFLVALEDGRVLAATPDLITVLGASTGEPIYPEVLSYGQSVSVLAAPAPLVWRTERGLALGGPRALGYEIDYAPILRAAAASA